MDLYFDSGERLRIVYRVALCDTWRWLLKVNIFSSLIDILKISTNESRKVQMCVMYKFFFGDVERVRRLTEIVKCDW